MAENSDILPAIKYTTVMLAVLTAALVVTYAVISIQPHYSLFDALLAIPRVMVFSFTQLITSLKYSFPKFYIAIALFVFILPYTAGCVAVMYYIY